ncbi:MAG: LysR family transcriptional regulator [Caulobacter sp.]
MDLKRLSYFALACQEQGFAATAAELGITQSTLSGALKTLSEEIGAPLFEQVQRRLHPTPVGLWLFRSAVPLLHAEAFARLWIGQGGDEQSPSHLLVDVRLSFALGRVAKAVSRAAQLFGEQRPDVFVEPCFSGIEAHPEGSRSIAGEVFGDVRPRLVIDAGPFDPDLKTGEGTGVTILGRDPWVVVRNARNRLAETAAPEDGPFIVPGLGHGLVEQANAAAAIAVHDQPAGMLPRMVWENPEAAFLVPRSLAADRVGLESVDIRPLRPPLFSQLAAFHDPDDAEAGDLARMIGEELAAPERNVHFRPVLSHRQMRYSRALFERGSITAAARSVSVAQPALTDGLHKLEHSLDRQLFLRSRDGLTPTPAGRRLNSAAQIILEGARRIAVEGATVVGGEGGRLKIGVVPPSGHASVLARCVARAIAKWRERFPGVRLHMVEGSNSALQAQVASGAVGLAVTDRTAPGMARFKLAESEALSVVYGRRFGLLPDGPVKLAVLPALPLVLPAATSGLRQILDAALLDAHLRISPALEMDSLPMIQALLNEEPFCSVLPVSAVQDQLDAGVLVAHTIVDPVVERQFYAFHAGRRDLNDAERAFLRILRAEFLRMNDGLDDAIPA